MKFQTHKEKIFNIVIGLTFHFSCFKFDVLKNFACGAFSVTFELFIMRSTMSGTTRARKLVERAQRVMRVCALAKNSVKWPIY